MASLIKDFIRLAQTEFPESMGKNRILLNFVYLYICSLPYNLFSKNKPQQNFDSHSVDITSAAWRSFDHAIIMYIRYLAPQYILSGYVVKSAMTGWHFGQLVTMLEEKMTPSSLSVVPGPVLTNVDAVSNALVTEFEGLDFDKVYRWLASYQYGIFSTAGDTPALQGELEDMLIVELGAGIGANAAVNASISKKGVCIFDLPPVIELQKRVISRIGKSQDLAPVSFYHDPAALMDALEGKSFVLVSNWAFTEFPMELRTVLEPLLEKASMCYFTCNYKFEGVENVAYFDDLKERISKDLTVRPLTWMPLRNHSCIMMRPV